MSVRSFIIIWLTRDHTNKCYLNFSSKDGLLMSTCCFERCWTRVWMILSLCYDEEKRHITVNLVFQSPLELTKENSTKIFPILNGFLSIKYERLYFYANIIYHFSFYYKITYFHNAIDFLFNDAFMWNDTLVSLLPTVCSIMYHAVALPWSP